MPIRCRTNWWLSERDTPEIPNQNTTCSRGETCPVFRRSSTNWAIFSRVTVPAAMSSDFARRLGRVAGAVGAIELGERIVGDVDEHDVHGGVVPQCKPPPDVFSTRCAAFPALVGRGDF